MKRIAGGVLGLVLLVVLAGSAAGRRQDFEARRAAARAALVTELEDFAEWCHSKDLFLEKQKAFELVLEFDPDHAEARKALGFSRDEGGAWRAPAKPKTPRNFDKKALEEAPGRFREAVGPYVGALAVLLEDPALTVEQRDVAAAEGLRFDPDNERIHGFLGDVRGGKGWVIPETLRAKARREELRGYVREALESVPRGEPAPLLEREQKIPLSLRALATPRLRVVGTVEEGELALTAQAVLGVERLLQLVSDTKYQLPRGATVFVLSDPAHRGPFLEHHPAVAPEKRASYGALEGAGIQGTADFAFWTGDAQRRIDGLVRLVLGYLMSGAFEITIQQGWAYEGFGLVLTRSLVRTRMTWLAQPSELVDAKADFARRQKLIDPETNWMEEAHGMLLGEQRPKLAELLKRNANQLTTEDVLYAYALATYLLEAQGDKVGPLLSRTGTGYSPAGALQEALGMDLEAFERHLCRWLSERN